MQEQYLEHHGILGQKWGVRRYQNADGTLTDAGRKRQAKADAKSEKYKNIGRDRLNRRIDKANKNEDVDKYAAKVGWNNTRKSGEAHHQVKNIKQISNEILEDDGRLEKLGRVTHNTRVATITGTTAGNATIAAGAAFIASNSWNPLLPLALGGASVVALSTAGYNYYKRSKY